MIVLTQGTITLSLSLGTLPTDNTIVGREYSMKLTSEATGESKIVILQSVTWDERVLTGIIVINVGTEDLPNGLISLTSPKYPAGFYQVNVYADDGAVGVLNEHLKCYALLERKAGEEGYQVIKEYNSTQVYNTYEQ